MPIGRDYWPRCARQLQYSTQEGRDLDKSIATFYQVGLTTAPRVVEFV